MCVLLESVIVCIAGICQCVYCWNLSMCVLLSVYQCIAVNMCTAFKVCIAFKVCVAVFKVLRILQQLLSFPNS